VCVCVCVCALCARSRFRAEATTRPQPVTGMDRMMLGNIREDGFKQSICCTTYQFDVPTLHDHRRLLREYVLKRLADPWHRFRLQLCQDGSHEPPLFVYSDEDSEVLCNRILVSRSSFADWETERDFQLKTVSRVDGVRLLCCDLGFCIFWSHVFWDGVSIGMESQPTSDALHTLHLRGTCCCGCHVIILASLQFAILVASGTSRSTQTPPSLV